jgi:hypothetical protein
MIVDVPGIPLRKKDGTLIYALVDPEDFVWLNEYRWGPNYHGYAVRHVGRRSERMRTYYMHREILGVSDDPSVAVDHINRIRWDNRRSNLRIATNAENAQNRGSLNGATSRFRGVSRTADGKKWFARVTLAGVVHYLGRFEHEEDAAQAAAIFRASHMPFSIEGVAA